MEFLEPRTYVPHKKRPATPDNRRNNASDLFNPAGSPEYGRSIPMDRLDHNMETMREINRGRVISLHCPESEAVSTVSASSTEASQRPRPHLHPPIYLPSSMLAVGDPAATHAVTEARPAPNIAHSDEKYSGPLRSAPPALKSAPPTSRLAPPASVVSIGYNDLSSCYSKASAIPPPLRITQHPLTPKPEASSGSSYSTIHPPVPKLTLSKDLGISMHPRQSLPQPPSPTASEFPESHQYPPHRSVYFGAQKPLPSIPQSPDLPERPTSRASRTRSFVNEVKRLSFTPSAPQVYPRRMSSLPANRYKKSAFFKHTSTSDVEASPISSTATQASLGSPPPDGGTLAWLISFSGFFVTFSTWGFSTAFGVFQAYYSMVMFPGMSISKVAWIGSVQIFLLFFLGTPVGMLMDRGYFRVSFNGGSALLLLGVFLTSICNTWWHLFLVQGIITGTGMGMVFCSGLIALMTYFSRKKIGLATAIAAVGSSAGAAIYALLFQQLILHHSFAFTMQVAGVIATVTLLYPNAIVRPRRDHLPPQYHAARPTFTLVAYKDRPYLVMCGGFFFAFWGLYIAFYYMVLYGTAVLGLSGTDSITLLIAMSAANIPGRLLIGILSDRYTGPLTAIVPATLISAIMTFAWIGAHSRSTLLVVACLYGFFAAGIQALYTAAIHSFAESDPQTLGQKSGLVLTVISFAVLTGAPIGGGLIGLEDGGFRGAQCFAGTAMCVGAGLLMVARWMRVGWEWKRA